MHRRLSEPIGAAWLRLRKRVKRRLHAGVQHSIYRVLGSLVMKSARIAIMCLIVFAARSAGAADPDSGKRLAQQHCSPCHLIEPNQRQELANSPPFETIARKYANAPELIAFAILSPHPRMNVTLSRREAQDLAAYIATLAK